MNFHNEPKKRSLRCPKCHSINVKVYYLTRAKCKKCIHRAHVTRFDVRFQKEST